MWSSTVGLVNGKHRYLTAETFGFKISSNGQQLKRRQQWTIEPFPENTGPDGSISSAASVSSQCQPLAAPVAMPAGSDQHQQQQQQQQLTADSACILTLAANQLRSGINGAGSTYSMGSASNQSEQDVCSEEHENVAIKSHLNKYLAVDSFGNVTCDSDEKTENARFTITICSMSQGRSKEEHIFWAFKNVERGYYLGTTDDGMICCKAKMPKSRAELWHLHLLPARGASFFAIKSLGRKRYARVLESGGDHDLGGGGGQKQSSAALQVQLDANISWGAATLFQFKYHEGGRYSLLTSNDQLLTNEGKCLRMGPQEEWPNGLPPAECLFTLEYHSGCLAFRDSFGQYLAAAGRSSILRSRSIGVSRDELFVFESVPIQVSFKATFNDRWVSIKQGVDLSANQMEISSKFETFQLTYQRQTQNWSIMTHDCNYWTVAPNSSTVSVCRPGDYEGLTRGQFRLIWANTDNSFQIKFIDINQCERWISARKSGQLFLAGPNHEPVKFVMRFQSRRLLNLRPLDSSGFLGLKSLGGGGGGKSQQLEANKTAPDPIEIEYVEVPVAASPVSVVAHCDPVAMRPSSGLIERELLNKSGTGVGQLPFDVKLNKHFESHKLNGISCVDSDELEQTSEHYMDGIDANNNNCLDSYEKPTSNGSGVETSSAPSVASIINSFSSAKIGGGGGGGGGAPAGTTEQKSFDGKPMSSAVSKLASSFESGATGNWQPAHEGSDSTSSVLTISSSLSGYSSGTSGTNGTSQPTSQQHETTKTAFADQVARGAYCLLKVRATGKYLTVDETLATTTATTTTTTAATTTTTTTTTTSNGTSNTTNESNIKCDSSSKTGAQSWTLELRSHNSVAIRASDTQAYMQLGTNGTVSLSRCRPEEATLWEF